MEYKVKVLADYVLIKQTMTAKESKIILRTAKQDKDKFDYTSIVLQVGSDCKRDIKAGDNPIFAEHVRFQGVQKVEETDEKIIVLVIVHESDIIGINENEIVVKEKIEQDVIKMN